MSYWGTNNIIENSTPDNERFFQQDMSINSSLVRNKVESRNIVHQQPYHHQSMYMVQPQPGVSTSSMRYPENYQYLMEKSNVQVDSGCCYDCRCGSTVASNFSSHSSVASSPRHMCPASTSASSLLINQCQDVTCCQKSQEGRPCHIRESRNSINQDNGDNNVKIPNWLKVYIASDMQHDQKVIWDMFNIRDLYLYDECVQKLYESHIQEIISRYKRYEDILQKEMEERLFCEANQRRW